MAKKKTKKIASRKTTNVEPLMVDIFMNSKYSDRDKIDDVMDNFNFERIHKLMVALDWCWSHVGGVPELPDIKKWARQCLKDSIKTGTCNTGGFEASYLECHFDLKFVVGSWDTYYLDEVTEPT